MSENSGMTDAQAALDSLDDYARMVGVEAIGPLAVLRGVIADRDRLAAEVLRLQAERDAMAKDVAYALLDGTEWTDGERETLKVHVNRTVAVNVWVGDNWSGFYESTAEEFHKAIGGTYTQVAALSPATSTGSEVGK